MSFHFDMVAPCAQCPFRKDIAPYLRKDRVRDILEGLDQHTFICHETTSQGGKARKRRPNGTFLPREHQHCAGALILLRKTNSEGAMQQIAERLGIYNPSNLKMDSPVYDTFDEMIEAQE